MHFHEKVILSAFFVCHYPKACMFCKHFLLRYLFLYAISSNTCIFVYNI